MTTLKKIGKPEPNAFFYRRLASGASRKNRRAGKILVLTAILFPAMLGVVAMVLDGGAMIAERRHMQHLADAAAVAAGRELFENADHAAALAAAERTVHQENHSPDATVEVNIPPSEGPFAGNNNYAEIIVSAQAPTLFVQALGHEPFYTVRVAAVAGHETATSGAAVMILDPAPPPISVPAVNGLLPPIPARIGGMEVLGAGELVVDGAVLVQTEWGGVDENGNPAGVGAGPPYALAATPLLPLTRLRAPDIRVVGGVDNPDNYAHIDASKPSSLRANKMPCPDPWSSLPAPTTTADSVNISNIEHGVVDLTVPLDPLDPLTPITVSPGVYEWIQVLAGQVTFEPGVYIIRNVHPETGIALNLLGGQVTAQGVMFYITNSPSYSPSIGAPDRDDGELPPPSSTFQLPSAVINLALGTISLTPLNSPASPFDGFTLYQRRQDRRPMIVVQLDLLGNPFHGDIYAKWGEAILVGQGTYHSRIVVGSMRVVDALECRITPSQLLPPARDVFLVE